MVNKYSTLFRWINIIVDYTILNGALVTSFILSDQEVQWRDVYDYKLTLLLINFCWFYCSNVSDVYNHILRREAGPLLNANIFALCLFIILAIIIKLALPYLYVPPTPFVYYFAIFPALILAWRLVFLLLRKHNRKSWLNPVNIAIIGAGPVGLDFYNYIVANPQLNCNVIGVFDDDPQRIPSHMIYLGNVEQSLHYSIDNKVNEIYCTLPNNECDRIEKLMDEADKSMIRFRLVPDLKGLINHKLKVEMFGFVPVLKPRQEPLENKANEVIKRIFDILFSILVIVLILSWLTPILVAIIKLDSKGPVFFRQQRSGKNNKPFYCLKFRSMIINTECDTLQACKSDTRVTRVGRFLRKTSIDELPQFFNVLMGDMSVIGPRPHMLKQTQDYSQLIDNYMVRHFLTPGITGWAQVNGLRGEIREPDAMLKRVKADLWYLENWSIYLDLKIVFLTIWKIISNEDEVY